MKYRGLIAGFALLAAFGIQQAQASVVAVIDKSEQEMTVSVDGQVLYVWDVSTARSGYVTPRGTYRPTRLHRMWYSRKYEMSPMPWSVFYHGGYAIHGTKAVKRLGTPASHGCIRLSVAHAATFYSLVSQNRGNTRIIVQN